MARSRDVGTSVPPPPGVGRSFPAQPASVGDARRLITDWLRASMPDQAVLIGDVALAVSEVCTNVVVHAYRDDDRTDPVFHVAAERDGGTVRATVSDEGGGMVPRTDSPGLGLGLPLLGSLTDAFEVRPPARGGGTVVEMRFSAAAPDVALPPPDIHSAAATVPDRSDVATPAAVLRITARADVDGDLMTVADANVLAQRGDPDYTWLVEGLARGDVMLMSIHLDAEVRGADGSRTTCTSVLRDVWIETGTVPGVEREVSDQAVSGLDDLWADLGDHGTTLRASGRDPGFIHVELSPRLRSALSRGPTAVALLTAQDAAAKAPSDAPAATVHALRRPVGQPAADSGRGPAAGRGNDAVMNRK